MTNQHPITPPPELVERRLNTSQVEGDNSDLEFATFFAQWGADQELEACCEWLDKNGLAPNSLGRLRSGRRPKPPSLKEQALEALKDIECKYVIGATTSTIRQALEALPND